MRNKFILLDRDGTIIRHVHHLINPDELELLPQLISGLIILKNEGYKFGIITNQSVINRGKISIEKVEEINRKLIYLLKDCEIEIEFVYVCPHTPVDGCNCRKPNISNGIKAISEFNIMVEESYMIGDMLTDIDFGIKLGMKTIQINSSNKKHSKANYFAKNIRDAAEWILKQ